MNKARKIFAIVLSFFLAMYVILPASSATNTEIEVSNVEGVAGSEVVVPISIISNGGFVSLSMEVVYDSSVLTLKSMTDTELLVGTYHSAEYSSPFQLNWINDISETNTTATGVIVELIFVINENAEEGTYDIGLRMEKDDAIDAHGNEVTVTLNSGAVTVVPIGHECSFGDWEEYNSRRHVRYCSGCEEAEYERHNYDDGEVLLEASHNTEGEIEYTCEDCGYAYTDTIDAEGHDFGDWEPYDDEQHKRVCDCGEDGSVEYEDHFWDDGVVAENGDTTYTCADCGATKVVESETTQIPVIGVSLSQTSVTMEIEAYEFLTATVEPANATNPKVVWASSDESVVSLGYSVENNLMVVLQSKAAGTATVTATTEDGAFVAMCVVTVTASEPEPEYIPGDINGDGVVNNKDVTRFTQYMANWEVEVVEAALDVNGDGSVNNKDVTRLMQYVAGWDVEIH